MTLSGPKLDIVVKEATAWYYEMAEKLMKALEEDSHPYGTVRLSPAEQVAQYLELDQDGWQALLASLERRYRGFPNSSKLVEDAATRYVQRMETLRSQVAGVSPVMLGSQEA